MADQAEEHEGEDTFGIALGFRILEEDGKYFLAEAEIAPYIDEPDELGVTVVFHPLEGINPVAIDEEGEWPSWPLDIDEDLSHETAGSMEEQFAAIVRQLYTMGDEQLKSYLRQAREEAEAA